MQAIQANQAYQTIQAIKASIASQERNFFLVSLQAQSNPMIKQGGLHKSRAFLWTIPPTFDPYLIKRSREHF